MAVILCNGGFLIVFCNYSKIARSAASCKLELVNKYFIQLASIYSTWSYAFAESDEGDHRQKGRGICGIHDVMRTYNMVRLSVHYCKRWRVRLIWRHRGVWRGSGDVACGPRFARARRCVLPRPYGASAGPSAPAAVMEAAWAAP